MRKYIVLLVLPLLLLSPAQAADDQGSAGKPKRGWLGVYPEDLSEAVLIALNVDHGVLVSDVVDESPAAAAGFQKGDVVLELDGVRTEDADDLRYAIRERPGKKIKALVRRRGKETRLEVALGEREAAELAVNVERELFELPEGAMRIAAKALKKVGPEVERVKVKVLEEGELREELENLREDLEELKEELEEQLEELHKDLKESGK